MVKTSGTYEFSEVPFGSKLQLSSVELRDKELRKPLGLQFSKEDLDAEASDHHLVCLENNEVVGVILMRPASDEVIKMRQVAVDSSLQHSGIGSMLVAFSEDFSVSRGYKKITMHARLEAVPFYERLGYCTVGALFVEVGIDHYAMEKKMV
ncbi:MAG: GNAT family N-acetyltransferase [Bacteroidetes bacterium]|nr:GNAT family N-acetyltransferase [Bacteroidota bacterium]